MSGHYDHSHDGGGVGGGRYSRIPAAARYTAGEWRRRTAASSFAVAAFAVAVASLLFAIFYLHEAGTRVELSTLQTAAVSGMVAAMVMVGVVPSLRSPRVWHGSGFIALAVIMLTTAALFTSPVSHYRDTAETMVSSIVAAGMFLMLGVLVLSGRPLCGTADDPASRNCQLLFALAVFLDCAGSATQFLYGSDGEAIFVATDEVGEGEFSAVVPNLIGMGCGYGGAFLALCAAAANFFTRCVCSQGMGPGGGGHHDRQQPQMAPAVAWAGMAIGHGFGHAIRIWLYIFQHGIALTIAAHGVAATLVGLSALMHTVLEAEHYRDERARFEARLQQIQEGQPRPPLPSIVEEHPVFTASGGGGGTGGNHGNGGNVAGGGDLRRADQQIPPWAPQAQPQRQQQPPVGRDHGQAGPAAGIPSGAVPVASSGQAVAALDAEIHVIPDWAAAPAES